MVSAILIMALPSFLVVAYLVGLVSAITFSYKELDDHYDTDKEG